MVEECQCTKVPIQELAHKITYFFVPTIIGISVLTFIAWLIVPSFFLSIASWAKDYLPWVNPSLGFIALALFASITVMVIACPCALGLATPTALMVGSGMGAERKAKQKAQAVSCINNLRQMSLASRLYADDSDGRFCFTFQVRGPNVFRKAWFNFLQPYQQTTNLLLCPVRTKKFNEFLQNYPSELPDKAVSNYGMNFRLGGCDWPGVWDMSNWPPLRDASVRNPATTVHLTDAGTRPSLTNDPSQCVTVTTPEKPGCWIVHDPGNDAPNTGGVTSTDPNWGGPHPRHAGRRRPLRSFLEDLC